MNFLYSTAHKATMISTLVIVLKFLITITIQGGKRFISGSRPPEDEKFRPGTKQTFGLTKKEEELDEKTKRALEMDIRWQRIVLNDLENLPIGLIVAWGSLLSAYSPLTHTVLVILFAIARILHTYSYANMLQPHRALCWAVAVLCYVGLAINGTLGVLLKSKL